MFRRIGFFYIREKEKDRCIDTKSDDKESIYCCFCTKTQYSFILNKRGIGERVDDWECRKSK